jgi:DNA-binding Lrp family transcriptional regulator
MNIKMADDVLNELDCRLIASLQCDGRVAAERVADVLGVPARVVQRRWAELLATGVARVAAGPPRPPADGTMLVRIRILRGKAEAVSQALARRPDVPLVELSASGDQVMAIVRPGADHPGRLLFEQLPTSGAVISVDAQTVIHVFSDAADWTADYLSPAERAALAPAAARSAPGPPGEHAAGLDEVDAAIAGALAADGRRPAAAVAREIGQPESTVRRRLASLLESGQLVTQVIIDPRRLGLPVDADLRMQVAPSRLDETGRALAGHPAVHGALATTGPANLTVAVWLRSLGHLYQFITRDLAGLGVSNVDALLIGRSVKRPAGAW